MCSRTQDLLLYCKISRATDCTTLNYNKALHSYGFELNVHDLAVLTGFKLRISVQLSKLNSPFDGDVSL